MSVDYIITENGMRIRKDVAIKPDASSQDKEINEDDLELLREKGLVRTIAKSKQVPKGQNLVRKSGTRPLPVSTGNKSLLTSDPSINYIRIDLPKEFLQVKKKNILSRRFSEGMIIYYGFRGCVCKILEASDTYLVLDIPAYEKTKLVKLHLDKSTNLNLKFIREQIYEVGEYNLLVVKKYWSKEKTVSYLLKQPITMSLRLLKDNNISIKSFRSLKKHLVPAKLSQEEFEQWASRLDMYISKQKELKKQKAADKRKKKIANNQAGLVKNGTLKITSDNVDRTLNEGDRIGLKHSSQILSDKCRKANIMTRDFVISVNRWRCINNPVHHIEDIQALIPIVSNGEILDLVLPGGYCPKCNQYFILSEYFRMNRYRLENALCTIIDIPTFQNYQTNGFPGWSEESILMKMGYTVAVNRDPGQQKRIEVLKRVIELDAMTKQEVMNHINVQIELRRNNPAMLNAIVKWRSDLAAISRMSFVVTQRKVIVGTIRSHVN